MAAWMSVACMAFVVHGAVAPVFPGEHWERRAPADVGLDATRLDALAAYLGGQGCVVRHGYLVFAWGDVSKRREVASACKPWYSHFLFRAVQEGRLAGLDEKAVTYRSCLGEINEGLGHKDREITFRHMANQVSCYGVAEAPGTAFDYNDWQMALFFDTLFLGVYGATLESVDETVLHALLTEPMGCEDEPTFLAFGDHHAGRVAVSVRDFARFGWLYLNGGNWNGAQLLDESWARMAVTSPLPAGLPRTGGEAAEMCPDARSIGSEKVPDNQTDHFGSYSFAWWINGVDRNGHRHWPHAGVDVYAALGHKNGKRGIAVFPSFDLVVSWNDTTLDERDADANPLDEAFRLVEAAAGTDNP